ncbi:cytochrome P450, partial [Tuber magnatum]
YGKYGKAFRIATPGRDIILFSNAEVLQELKTLPNSIAAFRPAGDEMIQSSYTFHEGILQDAYHVDLMRKNMTEKLSNLLPDIVEEITEAFEGLTNIKNEWTNLNIFNISIVKCILISLVGIPICQNLDYLDSVNQFSLNIMKSALIIDTVPWFLRGIVNSFLKKSDAENIIIMHIGREFEIRRKAKKSQSTSNIIASDAIQWILDAVPPETPILKLVQKLMFFNFASVHTTSIALTHILYDLAAHPEFQDPVCIEIEEVLRAEGGWTKQAITKMKKLDSILRESLRLNGAAIVTVVRKIITPYTFIDGTFAPKDTWVGAASTTIHHSPELYKDPEIFDGFRFYEKRQLKENSFHFQTTSLALDYLPFGIGKNSCPGRFFATIELKVAVAYILCNYRLRLNGGASGKRPQNIYEGFVCMPDPTTGIELKEREDRQKSVLFPSHMASHK